MVSPKQAPVLVRLEAGELDADVQVEGRCHGRRSATPLEIEPLGKQAAIAGKGAPDFAEPGWL
jgi:hypothetical protein